MDNNCPMGSDENPKAPWNQDNSVEQTELVDAVISITYSFKVSLEVPLDHTDLDLKNAVATQIMLPHENVNIMTNKDLWKGFSVDNCEVIEEG